MIACGVATRRRTTLPGFRPFFFYRSKVFFCAKSYDHVLEVSDVKYIIVYFGKKKSRTIINRLEQLKQTSLLTKKRIRSSQLSPQYTIQLMHTGKQKHMNAPYQASLVNRHIRRFTGIYSR